ncbi:hypothetical protein EW026_g5847 [Hermanssonia centrifuga]|uniref:Cell division control protein 14 n=1 Tax=Hermanssonia centrifuga TaxID=98765 RepID=A0A4S4KEJ6_9APHY|nr:hypothetical protein EW026_g5847 [Hermanssonia centrifuga]
MHNVIQDALDDLVSTRSSTARKGRALLALERLLADIYVPSDPEAHEALQTFISLQDTFQCNDTDGTIKPKELGTPSLASAVLDTLSCILVDSSPALRVFEDINGVKSVVKILKRQGTSREVKIKCMEFLYFYINSENATWTQPAQQYDSGSSSILVPTAPNSPTQPSHRSSLSVSQWSDFSTSSSSSGSDSSNVSVSTTATSLPSSRSPSVAPEEPLSQPSSVSIIPGLQPSLRNVTPPQPRSLQALRHDAETAVLSPRKAQILKLGFGTPRSASRLKQTTSGSLQPSEDVPSEDAVNPLNCAPRDPSTPRKALRPLNTSNLGHLLSRGALALEGELPDQTPARPARGHRRAQSSMDIRVDPPMSPPAQAKVTALATCGVRSVEEKKEMLRGMMSNVDSLLESMSKVGILGLG